jgi:hypothetical protein
LADDDERWNGLTGRLRSRNARLLRHRYKEGFDRLNIVLFVVFAAAFGLAMAFVNEPFALPAEGTPQAAVIAAEIAEACNQDLSDPFVLFCEERILGGHRWAYYQDQLLFDDLGWLYLGVLAVLFLALAWPTWRWVRAGFCKARLPDPDEA